MNLFYNDLNPQKNLRKLVRDIKKCHSISKKQPLFYGSPNVVNNNFLFIQENLPVPNFVKSSTSRKLLSSCEFYGIKNLFITASNLFTFKNKDKESIAKSIPWLFLFIEIVAPKMIVLLGKYPGLVFAKRKADMDEHGKIWDFHGDIPLYLTLSMKDHNDRPREQHKKIIIENDWKILQEEYKGRIRNIEKTEE